MKYVFITHSQHEKLQPLGFHQELIDQNRYLDGEYGVIVEDTSFYLFASLHLDGNTDFQLKDTSCADVKKLMINIVLDETDAEPDEESSEQMVNRSINAAMKAFDDNMDWDLFFDYGDGDAVELMKKFQNKVADRISEEMY